MKYQRLRARLRVALLAALLLASAFAPAPPTASAQRRGQEDTLSVRVGIVSYNNYAGGLERYGKELAQLSKSYSGPGGVRVAFQLAIGSYSDVLDWYNKELIDVAFLPPQPVAELYETLGTGELDKRYIATHASNEPKKGEAPAFEYGSVCMVEQSAPINDAGQLKEMAAKGKVSFLFVDPLSLSGRILPEYVLKHELGVSNIRVNSSEQPLDVEALEEGPPSNAASYTFSRSASRDLLREEAKLDEYFAGEEEAGQPAEEFESEEVYQVACFYSYGEEELKGEDFKGLKKVSFPALETKKLPEEVALATPSFALQHGGMLRGLFRVDQPGSRFRQNPYEGRQNWFDRFDEVRAWAKALKITSRDPNNRMFTLERIGLMLRDYQERSKTPPRLALVLSGGGAKCAYQLGAIRAIEEQLGAEPGIDLVVGTSGGAINALTVALGLTKYSEDDTYSRQNDELDKTWKGFRQKHFFSPHSMASFLLALTTALLQTVLLFWGALAVVAVARMFGRNWSGLYRFLGPAAIALALLNALVQLTDLQVDARGTHLWWHVSMLLTFNLYLTAFCLAVIGLLLTLLLLRREDFKPWFRVTHTMARNALLVTVVVLVVFSLFRGRTLSRADIVESTLAKKITALVDQQAAAELAAKDAAELPATISTLSDNIEKKLTRDLIITGSLLKDAGTGDTSDSPLPPDLYFYHDHHKFPGLKGDAKLAAACDPNPPADTLRRFRPFEEADGEGSHLLDVVIGSSSIYPIFPSRRLGGVGDIVDGGFAHNSPVEAAWMWKATHIILIEASPIARTRENHLLQNAQNAFNHLYYQAQLSDLRAHGKVEMFILRPKEPRPGEPGMCTFDFNSDAIERAIGKGGQDASGIEPRFERVHGEPVFEEVDSADAGVNDEAAPSSPCAINPAPGEETIARHNTAGRSGRSAAAPPRRN